MKMAGYEFIYDHEEDGSLTVNITYSGVINITVNGKKMRFNDSKNSSETNDETDESIADNPQREKIDSKVLVGTVARLLPEKKNFRTRLAPRDLIDRVKREHGNITAGEMVGTKKQNESK